MSLDALNGSLFVAGFSTRTCVDVDLEAELRARVGAHRTDHFDRVVEFQVQRVQSTATSPTHCTSPAAVAQDRRTWCWRARAADRSSRAVQRFHRGACAIERTDDAGLQTSIPWQLSTMVGNLLEPVIGGAIQLPARAPALNALCRSDTSVPTRACAVRTARFRFGKASRRGLSSSASARGCYAFGCGAAISRLFALRRDPIL